METDAEPVIEYVASKSSGFPFDDFDTKVSVKSRYAPVA